MGKMNWWRIIIFFLQFFLSNHDNPTLPLPRRQVIQNPENPRKEAAGPEPPYINISLYLNTTYNPGYGWGKYNMSCNPARTIFNSIMSRAIEKHMLSASLTFAETHHCDITETILCCWEVANPSKAKGEIRPQWHVKDTLNTVIFMRKPYHLIIKRDQNPPPPMTNMLNGLTTRHPLWPICWIG